MTIGAADRRTLMTWRQPTAHCHVTKKQNFTSTHELTQASHFGPELLRQIHDNFALTRKFSVPVETCVSRPTGQQYQLA